MLRPLLILQPRLILLHLPHLLILLQLQTRKYLIEIHHKFQRYESDVLKSELPPLMLPISVQAESVLFPAQAKSEPLFEAHTGWDIMTRSTSMQEALCLSSRSTC